MSLLKTAIHKWTIRNRLHLMRKVCFFSHYQSQWIIWKINLRKKNLNCFVNFNNNVSHVSSEKLNCLSKTHLIKFSVYSLNDIIFSLYLIILYYGLEICFYNKQFVVIFSSFSGCPLSVWGGTPGDVYWFEEDCCEPHLMIMWKCDNLLSWNVTIRLHYFHQLF